MYVASAPTRFLANCLGALLALVAAFAAANEPLHARIDRLIDTAAIGPIAAPCSDADFVRRVWLDLAGLTPSAATSKAFLENPSPEKRAQLIDELLASPHFVRHFTLVLDVALMERLPEKAVKTPEWQAYLYDFLAQNRPLDQLFKELIAADGVHTGPRPAVRFLLDRDCETNTLTRDLGRIYFGRDLQCAQCHDHPLIDDYEQAEYYGLAAFVLRSAPFNDPKAKQLQIAEKGEGEASFQSVFTKTGSDRAPPRLPLGCTFVEPSLEKGDEYVVAPAKDIRSVPKLSRRNSLAELLRDNHQFRRNLANRLWAVLLGRGLVHPLDGFHNSNPPVHPQVLTLLTEEFAAHNFDLRFLLREIALTRAYQRSCDPPKPEQFDFATLGPLEVALKTEREQRAAAVAAVSATRDQLGAQFRQATEERTKRLVELRPLEMAVGTAKDAHAKVVNELEAIKATQSKQQEQVAAVTEAAAKAKLAVEKLPQDKVLAEASAKITERQAALEAEAKALAEKVTAATAAVEMTAGPLAAAREALAKAKAALPPDDAWLSLEREERAALRARMDADDLLAACDKRLALVKSLHDYQSLAGQDAGLAAKAWERLVEEWTQRNQIAPLKALSAEQLALSLMQATGAYEPQRPAAQAAVEKAPPDELKNAAEGDKAKILEQLTERKLLEQLRGPINVFVSLYDAAAGQEFQATVNQALFFGNNNQVASWLAPGGGNLVERLTKLDDSAALTTELTMSLFSRPPTEDEKASIARFLAERSQDRLVAIQELVWALLASNEFRFNH